MKKEREYCDNRIGDILEYRIQKLAEKIDLFHGTSKGDQYETEYRQLLREKKRREKENGIIR